MSKTNHEQQPKTPAGELPILPVIALDDVCKREARIRHAVSLMRGIVVSPLGTNPERDTRIRSAWGANG